MYMEQITVTLPKRAEEVSASAAKKVVSLHGVVSTSIIREPSMIYYASKRLIDISLSLLGILVLTPVLLIIAACIKLDDGGPIIHPSELPRYGEWAHKRLSVRPGITGLWQISGRQHISYDERVLFDMRYIDSRSCITDLAILLKTLKVFIIHTGA